MWILRKIFKHKDNSLKYYIYISDAKLDMLYPQISQPLLKRIAGELNINLKLMGAELGTSIKDNQLEQTRYSKLRIVQEYIEKRFSVGTIDKPGESYFKGTLRMRWGPIPGLPAYHPSTKNPPNEGQDDNWVYFGGYSLKAIVGFLGSAAHIVGADNTQSQYPRPRSYGGSSNPNSLRLGDLINMSSLGAVSLSPQETPQVSLKTSTHDWEYLRTVQAATGLLEGPAQKLEFLAKILIDSRLPKKRAMDSLPYRSRIILGTPIYIAHAEAPE